MAFSYKGKHVLIIDDMPDARSYTSDMIRSFGAAHVVTRASGEDALENLRNEKFDLVLCDYNLGEGKDGQQVLEEVRHSRLLPNCSAFVMITADSSPEMVMGALEYQPDGYITKPYTKANLKQRLDKLLETKAALEPIEAALDKGEYQQALEYCTRVAKEQPAQKLRAARYRGQLLLMLRRFEEARDLYQQLLDIRPIAWARLGLGKALYYLGQKAEAEAEFRGLVEENKAYVEGLDWLAKVQLDLGRNEEAQQTLLRAIEQSPKAVLRQQELARIAESNAASDISEKAFRKSVHLGRHSVHKNADAYFGLVRTLDDKLGSDNLSERKKVGDETLRMLKEVDKSFDDRSIKCKAAAVKAHACMKLGKKREAEEAQARAEELLARIEDPDPSLQSLVEGVIEETGVAEAAAQRKAAFERSESLNNEGVALYKRGKLLEAFHLFEDAARNPGASPAVLMNALQASIALAQQGTAPEGWREECEEWNERLGKPETSEPHYQRLQKLRELLRGL